MLQPMTTRGFKIRTTLETSTPAITAAMSPTPATMATTPKTFSPGPSHGLELPKRATQLRGRLPRIRFPQHPDEHRPQRPVLLAVDQQLGEDARLRVPPELADPVGATEVGQHQDVEELGAWGAAECAEPLTKGSFELLQGHRRTPAP